MIFASCEIFSCATTSSLGGQSKPKISPPNKRAQTQAAEVPCRTITSISESPSSVVKISVDVAILLHSPSLDFSFPRLVHLTNKQSSLINRTSYSRPNDWSVTQQTQPYNQERSEKSTSKISLTLSSNVYDPLFPGQPQFQHA